MTSSFRILITGGSGFLGSRLAAYFLRGGHRVAVLIRDSSKLDELEKSGIARQVDIIRVASEYANIPNVFSEAEFDVVIHVAANNSGADGQTETQRLISANILFPALLLSAMKGRGIPAFINTGTSWQNAETPEFRPFDLYAATKEALEKILGYYVEVGISAVTLRLFDVYGPADPRRKVISLLREAAASGKSLDMSPGEQKIDLVHVDDACRAYGHAVSYVIEQRPPTHRVFGVSGGNPIPLRELVGLFERVQGVKCNINWGKRQYRPREIMEPYRGYDAPPGWCPRINLEEGLRSLVTKLS
jgi:nucleoside-diphosphate-sugar epimerase